MPAILGTGAGGYGALNLAFGVGAAAGAISIAALGHRFSREPVLLWAGAGFAASIFLLGLSRHFVLAFAVLLVAGLSAALNAILTNTMLQTEAPDDLRGQVVGFYSFIVVGMALFDRCKQDGWPNIWSGHGRAPRRLGLPARYLLGVAAPSEDPMIVTVSRQIGAGGSEIASRVAHALGFRLVDNA